MEHNRHQAADPERTRIRRVRPSLAKLASLQLILSSLSSASASLHLPLPEICFGNNRLKVQNERLGLLFEWDALRALHKVDAESSVKVAHADEWARG